MNKPIVAVLGAFVGSSVAVLAISYRSAKNSMLAMKAAVIGASAHSMNITES